MRVAFTFLHLHFSSGCCCTVGKVTGDKGPESIPCSAKSPKCVLEFSSFPHQFPHLQNEKVELNVSSSSQILDDPQILAVLTPHKCEMSSGPQRVKFFLLKLFCCPQDLSLFIQPSLSYQVSKNLGLCLQTLLEKKVSKV